MLPYEKLGINELILKSREGDDIAFAEILSRYKPMINKLISGFLGYRSVTDEAFSEASLAIHKAVLSYKLDCEGVTFGLYARICVQRRLSDFFRAFYKKEAPVDVSLDNIEDKRTVSSAEGVLLFREKIQQYMALARELLSDYEYRVFLLYIQNYDTDAICRELSCGRKSVENAKARMLKRLRANSALFAEILN